MRIVRVVVATVLIVLGTLYVEKNMPDEKWLLLSILLLAALLGIVQYFVSRNERREKRLDTISELRNQAHQHVYSAGHTLLRGNHKAMIQDEAEYRYEKLLEMLPEDMRETAPELRRGEDRLGGRIQVIVFLTSDPQWRDLLD